MNEPYPKEELLTKDDVLKKLNGYANSPDDDVILFKEKIKQNLLRCPELLYALNHKEYESELFNDDGTINYEGEWDRYFGTAIKPFFMLPETESETKTFLCYKVDFSETPKYNEKMYYFQVAFIMLTHEGTAIDDDTGIARHDLIGSIIRERFNWSNIFGAEVSLVSNAERTTDTQFIMRTMTFEGTRPKELVNTLNGKTYIINNRIRTS